MGTQTDDPRTPLPRVNYNYWPHGKLVARAYELERQVQALQEQLRSSETEEPTPPWIPCPDCDEFYCTIHETHAFECPCPPVEEWEVSPYEVSY